MAKLTESQRKAKAAYLDMINKKYLTPASNKLREGIKKGILPKNCEILWHNDATIKAIPFAKKI